MSAAKRIAPLDEGGIFARIDKHELPDLDDVLLEMLIDAHSEPIYWAEGDQWDDVPTRFMSSQQEADVRHLRISPCFCGEHGWHIDTVHEDEDGMPDRPSGRGAFLGVMFSNW